MTAFRLVEPVIKKVHIADTASDECLHFYVLHQIDKKLWGKPMDKNCISICSVVPQGHTLLEAHEQLPRSVPCCDRRQKCTIEHWFIVWWSDTDMSSKGLKSKG